MIEINGHKLEVTIFPDKTSQVWKLPESVLKAREIDIVWDFENEAELFHLCQLKDLINEECNLIGFCCLHIPFLPYGRQDKEVSNESTFALRTFAKIINSLNFDYVTSEDVHGIITNDLIENFKNLTPNDTIINILDSLNEDHIIAFPDKGATTRYPDFFSTDSIIADKERNQLTGYIEKYIIEGEVKNKNILIIDDICDGGMTFRLLAKELKKQGAKNVDLYVTHGIFSRGLEVLREDGINRIFTHKGEV